MSKFNEQKSTEAASILIEAEGGEINYMKLIKLLYFIDRVAFKKLEHPITYDKYYSMKDGQVLSNILDLVKNQIEGNIWHKHITRSGKYTVKLESAAELKWLTKSEYKLILDVYRELGKYDQFELGKMSKKGKEYKPTEGRIETSLIDLLSALEFNEDDIQEIDMKLHERADIASLQTV